LLVAAIRGPLRNAPRAVCDPRTVKPKQSHSSASTVSCRGSLNSGRARGRYFTNDATGDGMKTGFIRDSGFNVVASATRGNHASVAVSYGGRWLMLGGHRCHHDRQPDERACCDQNHCPERILHSGGSRVTTRPVGVASQSDCTRDRFARVLRAAIHKLFPQYTAGKTPRPQRVDHVCWNPELPV
jgi:hypothetical protein